MGELVLPDFVLIGAQRSGSTALARYLGAHPDIYMAEEKEVRFFTQHYDEGVAWYEARFENAKPNQMKGEATPGYMSRPEAMSRLAATLPRAKLLAVLRNPTDRAWSDYWMKRTRKSETRTFEEIIRSEITSITEGDSNPSLRYLWNGLYEIHLRNVLSLVGRDRVHIEVFEDMASNPESAYERVCSFLGVDPAFKPDNLGVPINQYVTFRSLGARLLARRIGGIGGRLLSALNTRKDDTYPRLSPDHRSQLDEFFRPHIAELEKVLGMDFDQWR